MRWKNEPKPYPGDERTRRKFAWLPTKVEACTVWFENYVVREEYKMAKGGNAWCLVEKVLVNIGK